MKEEQFKAAWEIAMPIVAEDMETIRSVVVSDDGPEIAIFITETLVKAIEGACACAQVLLGGPAEEGVLTDETDETMIAASLVQALETARRLALYISVVTADEGKKKFTAHRASLN